MTTGRRDWIAYLPDPSGWPPKLVEVVARGHYLRWNHSDDWIILMSTLDGDTVPVQCGGTVQARLAVNRSTGEIVHPTPGARIGQWEAEIYGEVNKLQRHRSPSGWDQSDNPIKGMPRDNKD